MAEFDLKTIGIFDEENYTDIIKKIIEDTEDDEPIFLLDIEDIVRKHKSWLTKMPRVVPHYGKNIFFQSSITSSNSFTNTFFYFYCFISCEM